MKKVLVVGLAVVLAAAGKRFADGNSPNNSSLTTTGRTSSNSSSGGGSGGSSKGTSGRPTRWSSSECGEPSQRKSGASGRAYPANVPVQNNVPVNAANARLRMLDRSELLARQAAYFSNRNRVNPGQSAAQSAVNADRLMRALAR